MLLGKSCASAGAHAFPPSNGSLETEVLCPPPPNSYVEAPTSSVTVLTGQAMRAVSP